jgi:DNA repair protein SbcC/Rad50
MIKRITLHNFQSHKHTVLDFTEGVNAIQGASDNGKTSCIRALKWVLTNRPTGISFINRDVMKDGKQLEDCYVIIETDNHILERHRTSTKNGYIVDGTPLNAIGTDVPEEVLSALNMNDINTQFQLDKPFLLTETPGEVARMLNKVVKLDDIDSTLKQLNGYTKQTKRQVIIVQEQLQQIEQDIADNDISELETAVIMAERLADKYATCEKEYEKVSTLYNDLRVLSSVIEEYATLDTEATLVEQAIKIQQQYDTVESKVWALEDKYEELEKLKATTYQYAEVDVIAINSIVQSYKDIIDTYTEFTTDYNAIASIQAKTYTLAHIDVAPIDEAVQQYLFTDSSIKTIDNMMQKAVSYNKNIEKYNNAIQLLEEEVKMMMKGTCPICGGVLHE